MNLIKAIFKKDPHIDIEHFKSEENSENGIISHDFIGFNLADTDISDVHFAKSVAKT